MRNLRRWQAFLSDRWLFARPACTLAGIHSVPAFAGRISAFAQLHAARKRIHSCGTYGRAINADYRLPRPPCGFPMPICLSFSPRKNGLKKFIALLECLTKISIKAEIFIKVSTRYSAISHAGAWQAPSSTGGFLGTMYSRFFSQSTTRSNEVRPVARYQELVCYCDVFLITDFE